MMFCPYLLVTHLEFRVDILKNEVNLQIEGQRQASLMVLEGPVIIQGEEFKVYKSCLLPKENVEISGDRPWICLFVY